MDPFGDKWWPLKGSRLIRRRFSWWRSSTIFLATPFFIQIENYSRLGLEMGTGSIKKMLNYLPLLRSCDSLWNYLVHDRNQKLLINNFYNWNWVRRIFWTYSVKVIACKLQVDKNFIKLSPEHKKTSDQIQELWIFLCPSFWSNENKTSILSRAKTRIGAQIHSLCQ